jgi:hypothetical protein
MKMWGISSATPATARKTRALGRLSHRSVKPRGFPALQAPPAQPDLFGNRSAADRCLPQPVPHLGNAPACNSACHQGGAIPPSRRRPFANLSGDPQQDRFSDGIKGGKRTRFCPAVCHPYKGISSWKALRQLYPPLDLSSSRWPPPARSSVKSYTALAEAEDAGTQPVEGPHGEADQP